MGSGAVDLSPAWSICQTHVMINEMIQNDYNTQLGVYQQWGRMAFPTLISSAELEYPILQHNSREAIAF